MSSIVSLTLCEKLSMISEVSTAPLWLNRLMTFETVVPFYVQHVKIAEMRLYRLEQQQKEMGL